MILPGATLGVLGGGQLGRMFAHAAQRLGYRVAVLDPDPDSPAGRVADIHLKADYTERQALDELAHRCAAVTVEFENAAAASLEYLARYLPVRPAAAAVAIAQDRIREKRFLKEHGFPTARFAIVQSHDELVHALAGLGGGAAVLKRARYGYDGKGQAMVANLPEAEAAFEQFGAEACVLEERLALEIELSVVLARGISGAIAVYPVAENRHKGGILDLSLVPARISEDMARAVTTMAQRIATLLDYVGVLAVEFFVAEGRLLVNEIAPRPHNSGHYTLDACVTSQFEQQVRTLCGLPLGDTRLVQPAVMVNLLGDLWSEGEPCWEAVLREPQARLHLYGKREPRPGRKMGHYTCLGSSVEQSLATALGIERLLSRKGCQDTGQGAVLGDNDETRYGLTSENRVERIR